MATADDIWQGYDLQGKPTSKPVTRQEAAAGALHGASHVWIWRETTNGVEILLQKRADDKRTWPGFYDISAAGHIDFGEQPLEAAIRETREEIGLYLKAEQLRFLFMCRQHFISPDAQKTQEHELRWVYSFEVIQHADLVFDDGEVSAVWWVNLAEFKRLIAEQIPGKQLVPQGSPYFASLLDGLDRFASA